MYVKLRNRIGSGAIQGYLPDEKKCPRAFRRLRPKLRTCILTPTTPQQSSLLSMLHGRASLRPADVAFTFTDYLHDPAGVPETLTWSQLHTWTRKSGPRELSRHASVGDRELILAPHGLDYILAFLGSMQAGLIAVPLPLPHPRLRS